MTILEADFSEERFSEGVTVFLERTGIKSSGVESLGLSVFGAEGILHRLFSGKCSLPGEPLDGRIGNAVGILLSGGTAGEAEQGQKYDGKKHGDLQWFHRTTVKDPRENATREGWERVEVQGRKLNLETEVHHEGHEDKMLEKKRLSKFSQP